MVQDRLKPIRAYPVPSSHLYPLSFQQLPSTSALPFLQPTSSLIKHLHLSSSISTDVPEAFPTAPRTLTTPRQDARRARFQKVRLWMKSEAKETLLRDDKLILLEWRWNRGDTKTLRLQGFKRAKHGNWKGTTHLEQGGKTILDDNFSVCSQTCPAEGSLELLAGWPETRTRWAGGSWPPSVPRS